MYCMRQEQVSSSTVVTLSIAMIKIFCNYCTVVLHNNRIRANTAHQYCICYFVYNPIKKYSSTISG